MKSYTHCLICTTLLLTSMNASHAQSHRTPALQGGDQTDQGKTGPQGKPPRLASSRTISTACQPVLTNNNLPPACHAPDDLLSAYCIDASSNYSDTTISVGHKNAVQLYLINKNPFVFNYTVTVSKADFASQNGDALSAFTGAVGLSTTPAPAVNQKAASQALAPQLSPGAPGGGETVGGPPKSACQTRLQAIEDRGAEISLDLKTLSENANALASTLQGKLNAIAAGVLQSAGSRAAELCAEANSLKDDLDLDKTALEAASRTAGVTTPSTAENVFGLAQKELKDLDLSLSQYKNILESTLPCKDSDVCVDTKEESKKERFVAASACKSADEFRIAIQARHTDDAFLSDAGSALSTLKEQISQIAKAHCHIQNAKSEIRSILSNENSFYEKIGPYGPYLDSEDVTVAVSRSLKSPVDDSCISAMDATNQTSKPSTDKTKVVPGDQVSPNRPPSVSDPVSTVVVHFGGGQRVYAAAGPVVSFLPVREFQRAPGFASDGKTPATVIDYNTNSGTRVAPVMGFLHVRPTDSERFFLSLGITAKSDNKNTAAEFLFGSSYGLYGNWLFLTGGAYLGQQQKLAGNLAVGQTVPSSLTGEIPVQKSYHWSVGFSLNVRIPGTGNKGNANPQAAPTKKPSGKGLMVGELRDLRWCGIGSAIPGPAQTW
jgi:hypothetical protein